MFHCTVVHFMFQELPFFSLFLSIFLSLSPLLLFLSICTVGTWCSCWRNCVYCLLPSVQTLHSQTDQKAAECHVEPRRFTIHQSPRIHVHQVSERNYCIMVSKASLSLSCAHTHTHSLSRTYMHNVMHTQILSAPCRFLGLV